MLESGIFCIRTGKAKNILLGYPEKQLLTLCPGRKV